MNRHFLSSGQKLIHMLDCVPKAVLLIRNAPILNRQGKELQSLLQRLSFLVG